MNIVKITLNIYTLDLFITDANTEIEWSVNLKTAKSADKLAEYVRMAMREFDKFNDGMFADINTLQELITAIKALARQQQSLYVTERQQRLFRKSMATYTWEREDNS